MNRRRLFVICGITILIGIAAFFQVSRNAVVQTNVNDSNAEAQSKQDRILRPPPPPPPPPPTERVTPPPEEPPRALVGVTDEDLLRVQQLLPNGQEIAKYPIDNSHEKAALSYTDLDRDGKPEVIFVHTLGEPATTKNIPLLTLDVVTNNGENPTKRISVQLAGMYVYNDIYDNNAAPFAIRDITGDGRPEIIVTSAIGASIGATLQAFSFNGESLIEIARIQGNDIDIIDRGVGKAAVIRSRWKDERTVETFVWSGKEFQAAK